MKLIANFLSACLLAGWIITMAVFSIQNISLVSLKFFQFESIKIPIGVLLAICVGLGLVMGSLLPVLLKSPQKSKRYAKIKIDEIEEFKF